MVQLNIVSPNDPLLNKANLDTLKCYIIARGNRCHYCTMYGNNPCWILTEFYLFLNPDRGPDGNPFWNCNCDVSRGDFNTLVVRRIGKGEYGVIRFIEKDAVAIESSDEPPRINAEEPQTLIRAAVSAALETMALKREMSRLR